MTFVGGHTSVLVALAILVLSPVAGWLLRRSVRPRLRALAARTSSRLDDVVLVPLTRPFVLWSAVGGAFVALRIAPPPPQFALIADRLLMAVLVLSVTWWSADVGVQLLDVATRDGAEASSRVTGVLRNTVRAAAVGIGATLLLGSLGVSITPLVTTLGIGGLAVALGLQETLANVFAGIYLTLAGNIRVGDFVSLETGQEGYVEDIRWRATRIRQLANNVVLIPNGRLAQCIVTNYHLPAKDLAVLVQVGVHYASDLGRVEQVTIDVGREIMRTVRGGVPDFEPFIRYHTLGDSSIGFTVILRANEFVDNYLVKHEFIKALARRYAQEGIVIPFPIRAINVDQERGMAHAAAGPGGTTG